MKAYFRNISLYFLFSILIAGSIFAQPATDSISIANIKYAGDLHYEKGDYDLALTEYRKIYTADSTDTVVHQLLANCYLFLKNPKYTAIFLRKSIDAGNRSPENLYHYSRALRTLHRYKEYKKWSLLYADSRKKTGNTQLPKAPNWGKDISHDSLKFKVNKTSWKGEGANISPTKLRYGWLFPAMDEKSEYKIWFGEGNSNETPQDPFKTKGKAAKIWTEGPIAYAESRNRVFFTGGGKALKGGTTQIYTGTWSRKKNKIIKVAALDLGTGNAAHPTCTQTGEILFFASDRAGGQGGWDIWSVAKEGTEWGTPKNLGPKVNGPGNELFPWITADRTLFFASDRKGGVGGLDVYYTTTGMGYTAPNPVTRLPYPVNSVADDIGITAAWDQSIYSSTPRFTGYITSNRGGDWQVYEITKQREHSGTALVARNGNPIVGAIILVEAPDGASCLTQSGPSGVFSFAMENTSGYSIGGEHPEFFGAMDTTLNRTTNGRALALREREYYDMSFWVYDSMNLLKLVDADIEIIKNEQDTVHYQLDTLAKFKLELEPGNAYKVKVSHPGYFDWTTQFTAFKNRRKSNNQTLKMRRKIGTMVRGKLDAAAGTDFSNTHIIPVQGGKLASPLTPPIVNLDGTYEIFLPKNQEYTLYVTLDEVLSGSVLVKTNESQIAELNDTVDLYIDVKRVKAGSILFSFSYDEDPIQLQAGVYTEMKDAMILLESFPAMKLEFAVHASTLRNNREARTYTQEAAEFGADYYHYREIPKARMVPRGYGITQPLINCRRKKCSIEEHRKNRRVEIRVLDPGK